MAIFEMWQQKVLLIKKNWLFSFLSYFNKGLLKLTTGKETGQGRIEEKKWELNV